MRVGGLHAHCAAASQADSHGVKGGAFQGPRHHSQCSGTQRPRSPGNLTRKEKGKTKWRILWRSVQPSTRGFSLALLAAPCAATWSTLWSVPFELLRRASSRRLFHCIIACDFSISWNQRRTGSPYQTKEHNSDPQKGLL